MSTNPEELQRERERQREHDRENYVIQEAFNAKGNLDRGWMREILDVDDLEEKLQPQMVAKVQSMLNKQWIVSNLTDAEVHDRWYWLDVQKLKLLGAAPPEGSRVVGELRANIYNDRTENIRPLTSAERNAIDQIIKGLQNMVTRSRGGFEREQINTNIARTETESKNSNQQSSGGLRGLFSR